MQYFNYVSTDGKTTKTGYTSVSTAAPATWDNAKYVDPVAYLRAIYGDPTGTVTFPAPPVPPVPAYQVINWTNTAVTPNTVHQFTVTPTFFNTLRDDVLTAQALANPSTTFGITDNAGVQTAVTTAQLQAIFALAYAVKP